MAGGDVGEQKPGTDSISTGTNIIPARKPNFFHLKWWIPTPSQGDGGWAKKNGGKSGLYNFLVQKIDVGVQNDQMLQITALKFEL